MHRHRIEYGKNVVDKFGNRYSQPFIMPVEKTQEECASERVRNPTRSQGQSRRLPSELYPYAGLIEVEIFEELALGKTQSRAEDSFEGHI